MSQARDGGGWDRVAAEELQEVVRFWTDFESRADKIC